MGKLISQGSEMELGGEALESESPYEEEPSLCSAASGELFRQGHSGPLDLHHGLRVSE